MEVPVDVLDGLQAGVRLPVGGDEAVHAEVVVVVHSDAVLPPAAVGKEGLRPARRLVFRRNRLTDALVDPVPDECSLRVRPGVEDVPVLLEPTRAVPHRMGVLAEDEGHRRPLGRVLHHRLGARVHERVDVGARTAVGRGSFVVDRPRGVAVLDHLVRGCEVGAVTGLVAHGPDDDRGMVLVPLDHARAAVEDGRLPDRVVGDAVPRVGSEPVGLEVGLVDEVEAVPVAEVVPLGIVGIVGRPHRVDVVLLHQLDVVDHQVPGQMVPGVGVVLVTVDALDEDGAPVHEQPPVTDLHLAEADVRRDHLDDVAARVLEGQQQAVEVGRLGRPVPRCAHRDREDDSALPARHDLEDLLAGRCGRLAIGVGQLDCQRPRGAGLGRVAHERLDAQHSVLVCGVQVGMRLEVPHVLRTAAPQDHVPEDAAQAEHVLVLEERAVAPAIDLRGQGVRARLQEARDVELDRKAAVLAVPDLVPVDPDVEGRIDTAELQVYPPAAPACRNLEGRAIRAHRVLLTRDARRLQVDVEGIADVRVDRYVEAFDLPVGGDTDLGPGRVVVVGPLETRGTVCWVRRQEKPPPAVERLDPRRSGPLACPRGVRRRVGREGGMGLLRVEADHRGIVPLGPELGGGAEARRPQKDRQRGPEASVQHRWSPWFCPQPTRPSGVMIERSIRSTVLPAESH